MFRGVSKVKAEKRGKERFFLYVSSDRDDTHFHPIQTEKRKGKFCWAGAGGGSMLCISFWTYT